MTITIKQHLKSLEAKYDGLRPACRALGIDPAYWVRLRSGEKDNPSDYALTKLGLYRTIVFHVRN